MSSAAVEAVVCSLTAFVGLVLLFGCDFWERAQQRKEERNKRERLVNEAIQLDIAARSRKHTIMRQMRDVARDYRRP